MLQDSGAANFRNVLKPQTSKYEYCEAEAGFTYWVNIVIVAGSQGKW